MTAEDKDFIQMTAKLTAQETVKEFRVTLNCDKNVDRIGDLEQTVNNGIKSQGEENAEGLRGLRRVFTYSLIGTISLLVGGIITAILT